MTKAGKASFADYRPLDPYSPGNKDHHHKVLSGSAIRCSRFLSLRPSKIAGQSDLIELLETTMCFKEIFTYIACGCVKHDHYYCNRNIDRSHFFAVRCPEYHKKAGSPGEGNCNHHDVHPKTSTSEPEEQLISKLWKKTGGQRYFLCTCCTCRTQ